MMRESQVESPSCRSVHPRPRLRPVPLALASWLALSVVFTLSCKHPDHDFDNARRALDRAISQRIELQRRLDVAIARAYHLENQLKALRAQLGMTTAEPTLHDVRRTTANSGRKRW
jgi:hypothetical protein